MSSFFTDQNFLDSDLVNVRSASSEKANFPADNLYDRQQRSEIWRSEGYYNIEDGSNTIVFRETAATDLTATITADEYTTPALLATAIKTALEAAGGSVYTVSRSTTSDKWVITSDGAGGGGIFEIIWTDASSAAMAGILGYSTGADDTGGLTYTGDFINLHTDEWLLWDLGLSSLPEYFYVFGDRNEPIELSSSATIQIQGNFTDNFSTQIFSETIPYDGRVIHTYDLTGFGSTYLRYWRLRINDPQIGSGFVQLGHVSLGNILRPSRGRIAFGFGGSYRNFSNPVRVVGGQVVSNVRPCTESFRVTWSNLTKQDRKLFEDHYKKKGLDTAFVAHFDPMAALGADQKELIRLVKYAEDPQWSVVSANNFTVAMTLEEAL